MTDTDADPDVDAEGVVMSQYAANGCPECGEESIPIRTPNGEGVHHAIGLMNLDTGDIEIVLDCPSCSWSREYRITGEVVTEDTDD